jgi:hypothetical protein
LFEFSLSLKKLVRGVIKERTKTWDLTKRYWNIGTYFDNDREMYLVFPDNCEIANYRTAKKNFVHGIRYLKFGLQILAHGKITDYHVAIPFYKTIMADTSVDWDHYAAIHKPHFEGLRLDLKSKAESEIGQAVKESGNMHVRA